MPGLDFADDALGCVADADAVVLVTEWDQFKQLDFAKVAGAMAGTVIIDGRNALDPEAVRAAGLLYEGVGQG
jgi:UDPglucose 6-dehydrogenase